MQWKRHLYQASCGRERGRIRRTREAVQQPQGWAIGAPQEGDPQQRKRARDWQEGGRSPCCVTAGIHNLLALHILLKLCSGEEGAQAAPPARFAWRPLQGLNVRPSLLLLLLLLLWLILSLQRQSCCAQSRYEPPSPENSLGGRAAAHALANLASLFSVLRVGAPVSVSLSKG